MTTDSTQLRPMEVGDIFGEAWTLYQENFVLFWSVLAIPLIIAAILNLIIFGGIVGGILSDVAIGAIVWAISARYLGRAIDAMEPYRQIGAGQFVQLVISMILAGIVIAIGLIFFIIPGIFLAVKLAFIPQAIVIERQSIFGAWGRSWELTASHFWRVLGVGILIILVYLGAAFVGAILAAPFGRLGGLVGPIINIIAFPYVYGAGTMLYYDLRHRKEGFGQASPVTPTTTPMEGPQPV